MPPLGTPSLSFKGCAVGVTARTEPEPPCWEPAPPGGSPCFAPPPLAMPKTTAAPENPEASPPSVGWSRQASRVSAGGCGTPRVPAKLSSGSARSSRLLRGWVRPPYETCIASCEGRQGGKEQRGRAEPRCLRRVPPAPQRSRARTCLQCARPCLLSPLSPAAPQAGCFSHLRGDVPLAQAPGASCSLVTEDLISGDSQAAPLQGPRS